MAKPSAPYLTSSVESELGAKLPTITEPARRRTALYRRHTGRKNEWTVWGSNPGPRGYESPARIPTELTVHYENLAGALLGFPAWYPSLYSATYATALAPKGYTLDGLTCIISDETFLNIQALLAGPYRFTQPWPVRGPRSNQFPEREWHKDLMFRAGFGPATSGHSKSS